LEELVRDLPPELEPEVRDFVEFLLARHGQRPKGQLRLDWKGALQDLRDQMTSVELQHKALDWRED
jgi:hypothetical protein